MHYLLVDDDLLGLVSSDLSSRKVWAATSAALPTFEEASKTRNPILISRKDFSENVIFLVRESETMLFSL